MNGSANPLSTFPCRKCGELALELEWREITTAKPLMTWSLSGAQLKTSAVRASWPWCVCRACGAESKGKITNE